MIDRKIRDTRTELYRKSIELKELTPKIEDYEKSLECREKEQKVYDKWKFYHNLIKAMDKK